METHVKVVAILNIVLGAMGVVGAAVVLLIFSGMMLVPGLGLDAHAGIAVPVVGGVAVVVLLAISVPVLIGGIALWLHAPWSRVYMIVLSAIELVNVPFGTALGIYSIWALTRPETPALFKRRGDGTV